MKTKWLLVIVSGILFIWMYQSEWIKHLLENDISFFVELHQSLGYNLLWVTIPLAIIQGIITIFPFVTIVIIHVLVFGLVEGLFYSWLGGVLSSLICFILGRYLFYEWSQKVWRKRRNKYKKWQFFINLYGFWSVIFLRTIPIIPSNMISLMAALSPMKFKAYVGSSLIGNFSMVWLLGILSFTVTMPDIPFQYLLIPYLIYSLVLISFFIFHFYHFSDEQYNFSVKKNFKNR